MEAAADTPNATATLSLPNLTSVFTFIVPSFGAELKFSGRSALNLLQFAAFRALLRQIEKRTNRFKRSNQSNAQSKRAKKKAKKNKKLSNCEN